MSTIGISKLKELKIQRILFSFFALLFIILFLINFWVSDDIYISYRCLYNFVNGYGLTWNSGERVQVFTHPLWLLFNLPTYFIIKRAYWSVLLACTICVAALIIAIGRYSKSLTHAIGLMFILISSKSFIDYSASGLENSLSHFLTFIFICFYIQKKEDLFSLSLIASLLMLNRLDLALICIPALLFTFFNRPSLQKTKTILLGFSPLIVWEIFALIYYGFLLPNTFYAKAVIGFEKATLIQQGYRYYQDIFFSDPIVPILILSTLVVSFFSKLKNTWPILTGILLYLFYILWVGGDYMSGRFFTVPYLASATVLAHLNFSKKYNIFFPVILLFIALLNPLHPMYTGKEYYQDRSGREKELYPHGIVDEKGMSWKRSSLILDNGNLSTKIENSLIQDLIPIEDRPIEIQRAVGLYGYSKGPNVFIIDELAVTDPMLAKLPALKVPYWRIGHFFRRVPKGYQQSVKGKGEITDASLDEYYNKLKLLTRAPIWNIDRWKEIFLFNTGQNDYLINKVEYQIPTTEELNRFN